jgi:hypothetical protein
VVRQLGPGLSGQSQGRLFRASWTLMRRREGTGLARQDNAAMFRREVEEGQSLLEIAVTFPLFVLVILAIGAVSWTFWVQAASAIASEEAARHAAYRAGDSFDPTAGYGPFSEAMAGITSSASASYIGHPLIAVNPATRSVQVSVSRGATFRTPATSAEYTFRSGTFTRIMQFFGGPPDPWE